ncbi:unnamed protein product [Lathyrus oleraceus]
MISVKSKNQKTCLVFLLLLLLILLLLLSNATCEASARFDTFKSKSKYKFHGDFQGRNKNEDQVFGDDKRKVYTGPNPLHNR